MTDSRRDPEPKPQGSPVQVQGDAGGEPEEVQDDAVIGVALRYSLVVIVLVLAVAGVAYWMSQRPETIAENKPEFVPPQEREKRGEPPLAKFKDVTKQAGITYVHHNGATGEKLLPETMGGGVAFLDFDNDDDPDLLFVNSCPWPWTKAADGKPKPTMVLYRNDGKGNFTDITSGSGLDVTFYGMGVAVGDYDNDGFVDLFFSAVGPNRLFRNLGGTGKFEDVTERTGVAGDPNGWGTGCGWFDYDRDGDLDLLVCNYIEWSRQIDLDLDFRLVGVGRAYGRPQEFAGAFPQLYRNDGNGKFTDVSDKAGIKIRNHSVPDRPVAMAKSLGLALADLDEDGWLDVVIANDTVQNMVFHNQQNGTFREVGVESGIAFDMTGGARGAMGIDAAYFRNDGAIGITIGNFANEMTSLYVSRDARGLLFNDEANATGLGPASRLLLKFGIFFFDFDLDGRLDILSANGHLEQEINKVFESQHYAQPVQLYWNAGPEDPDEFVVVPPAKCGADLVKPMVGRGSAYADIDGDGDLDVVVVEVGGPARLLRNDQALGHHWLRLKLVGKEDNRDAIGAMVELHQDKRIQRRVVMPTRSYLSQSELPVTFGLGKNNKVDLIKIRWPNGSVQEMKDVEADRLVRVEQGR